MTDKAEVERRMRYAREKAARAYTSEKTSSTVMDPDLCEEFAKILCEEMYTPKLGCATTRELIDELLARLDIDLDYCTVGGGDPRGEVSG